MKRYKQLVILPIAIIVLSVYLIGINMLNRCDYVDEIADAVPASTSSADNIYKSEEAENQELENIGDKININTASVSELMLLDGIGKAMAQRIINKRSELGRFSTIEDILSVEGIGKNTFEGIKNYITVE